MFDVVCCRISIDHDAMDFGEPRYGLSKRGGRTILWPSVHNADIYKLATPPETIHQDGIVTTVTRWKSAAEGDENWP